MIKKRWIFFFVALLILCGLGLIDSEIGAGGFWGLDPKVDAANVAWMITATIFVLMMTPGLSFFYGGMVRAKTSSQPCSKALLQWVSSAYCGYS